MPTNLTRALAITFAVAAADFARADTDESAYVLDVAYTGEAWRNTHGGLRTGSSYLDKLDVQLAVNGERAWGVSGLTVFGHLMHNNGGTITEDLIGDGQAVSNIEGFDQTRLYELWADWAFGPERAYALRVGLYDVSSEFDVSDVGALFISSSHGTGVQLAQTGLNGPSIFPVTSVGARLLWRPASDWTVQFVALDGVPGIPERPSSNEIHLGGGDGLLFATEVYWQGEGRLRKAALGGWSYTADFDDLLEADPSGAPVRRGGNDGVYALVEANLWSTSEGSLRSLDAYVRYGTANDHINRFHEAWAFGVVATGPFAARPADLLGFGVAIPCNGRPYREASALAGQPVEPREHAFELTYRAEVTDWLTLQPTIQYIVEPDSIATRPDALAAALRFELAWGKRF